VCFAERLDPTPLFFFFFLGAGSSPTNMGGAGVPLAQASDPAGQQACVAQPTCALHSANDLHIVFLQQLQERLYLVKLKAKVKVIVQAPAEECSPSPPFFSLSSLCSWFFFCSLLCFLTSVVFLVFLPCFFSLFFFFFLFFYPYHPPLCAYIEIYIYSARVPSRVRNKVSIKLILFFEV